MSGDNTKVSGVGNICRQTGDGLLSDGVLFDDQVIELEAHLSVTRVGTKGFGQWGDGASQNRASQNPVASLDDVSDRGHVYVW